MAITAPTRTRRLLTILLVATALVAGLALTPMAARAVHDEGLFELDGNIADSPVVTGQDWSAFQGPVAAGDTAPISTVFISDGFNGVNDTIYFGGGSQNNNDITSWRWSCGGVSTKSDIEHAFATAYIKNDQLYLYFGGDRFDPTGGTTNIGFWFLQDGGALEGGSGCPDGDPATNTFSGQHVDGDLFVFAEFAGGGGDSGVSIYEWLNGHLHLLAAKSSGSFCNPDESICAQSNSATIASTWPYTDNQGSSTDGEILQGGFVEGGINLSSIYEGLGKDLPCVNRFLAQTGSSHPDTGVLEDFAGGSFNVCSKLIVDKVTPSGDQTSFPFSVSGPNGYSDSFQLASADTPHDSGQVKSGTYTVTETPGDPTVWNAPSVSCLDQGNSDVTYANGEVDIEPGATVTCTFTNSKKPQLTVIKKIVGGNGTTDSFDVQVDGATKIDNATSTDSAGTSSGAFAVSAGTHSVTETLGDGSPISPSNWGVSFSGDCDSSGNVDVQDDGAKMCTITNSKLPRLTVVKQIVGGNGAAFDLDVNDTTVLDDVSGTGGQVTGTYPVDTAYVVSETLANGDPVDPALWETTTSGQCSGTLAAGDDKTCTITNKRKPTLTVVKQIEGGDGSSFDISVGQMRVLDDAGDGATDTRSYDPGTYAITETLGNGNAVPAGWSTSYSSSCSQGSVTLAYGDAKTCTITNSKLPTLTVVKQIEGGDGSSFDISVGQTRVLDDAGDGASDERTYAPGSYAVSETFGDGGAIGAGWTVVFSGDCDSDGNVSLAYGDAKTCTITNSKLPTLTVVKQIEGGDGSSFDISVGQTRVLDDAGDGASDERTYAPGSYSVSETFGDGGAIGADWTVVFSGDCDSDGNVSLAYGDAKTCTITNSKLPRLTVVKQIEGGDGSSFDISVGQTRVLDDAGDGASDERTYAPGSYSVSETFGDGGAIGADWTVVFSGDCDSDGNVSLAYGDAKTCTITNSKLPRLTVVKQIVGGNGAAFDLDVNDTTVLDDVSGTGGQVTGTYPVDTAYVVSETLANGDPVDPALWETTTSGQCSGTLAAGDDKTCTITNKRKPTLTVVKQIEGGDGSSFDISVGQTRVLDDAGDGASDERTYAPGSYSVSETFGDGGAIGAGWTVVFSGDCDSDGNVSLAYGDAKTCTITNSKLPQLIVIKNVVGGAKSSSDFQISVSGDSPSPSNFPGSADGTVVTLNPGAYDVSEGEDPHYAASYSTDCQDGSIEYGETKTCTITNTRRPASITIDKIASPTSVPEPGGTVTFTLRVHNASPVDIVTIDELTDSVYGNVFLRGNCGTLQNAQLAADDNAAGGLDEATCSFSAVVSGNAGDSHHNVASVTGHDEDGRIVTDDDFADVELTDVTPSIEVTKTADPITVAEPGALVEFTVEVTNTSVSSDPVTITSLVDDPDGDGPAESINLNGNGSCSVPQLIEPGETYTCTFSRMITGNAGDVKIDVVTAAGHDDDEHSVSDHDDAEVTITDVASSISVDKSATPTSVREPGGDVAFTVAVKNTSAVDAVTIDAVVDSIYGDLATKGTCGTLIGKVLQPDDHASGGPDEAQCTFTGAVAGGAGTIHTNVATVTGHDDDEEPLTAHDDATVTITPAPVVPKLIDLFVTKTDLPDPVQLNGQLTYTIVVGNNGPDAATQVTLADPLPVGTSFVSVSTTQGTCTGGALIRCDLGTIPAGSTVTITLVVTALQSGVLTNTVTVVGNEPEPNTANNTATATTLVPAPLVRAPKAAVCDKFTATPKSLRVGKRSTIVVHVTASGKPVKGRKVVVKGAGILKSGRTNARGIARIRVTPRRAGIVTITVPQKLTCGGKRIGVVGAFEQRFTG